MGANSIIYENRKLQVLDQTLLPQQIIYIDVKNVQDGWDAIKLMKVRGAPAIAVVGALSLAVDIFEKKFDSNLEFSDYINLSLDHLITARPTAVNIFRAADDIKKKLKYLLESTKDVDTVKENVITYIEDMIQADIKDNVSIGDNGAKHIMENIQSDDIVILTHCNAGALATAGYGTALGVIRSLKRENKLKHVFCTETRAYNQGARLTAFELVQEGINATLITDSSVSIAMQKKGISAVVVGADRVAANGDTANKIGTYQIAIAAKYHGIPFYAAVPTTTIDLNISCGDDIIIEERDPSEITHYKGENVAAPGIGCWNPAFDVTPASLITGGIITEFGVFKPVEIREKITLNKRKNDN